MVLNHATTAGSDRSDLERFRRLDVDEAHVAVDSILDAHLINLDEYRPGRSVVAESRLPGSTRYMAPEEFTRGASIDERTTVFHLGRVMTELLGEAKLTVAQRSVARRATHFDVERRFRDVERLVMAWRDGSAQ